MEGLKMIPMIFIVIAISGVIGGAAVISLVKFQDTVDQCYSSDYTESGTKACVNATPGVTNVGESGLNLSDEYYSIMKANEGQTTIAEQLPTVAIIAIMVIIISIIAGVFVYLRYFA